MTNKQAQKVLDEMQGVVPELLYNEAKKVFEAIMKIADERDELKKELKQKENQIEKYINMLSTNDLLHIKEIQEKDKIIDLMAEYISNMTNCSLPFGKVEYLEMYPMTFSEFLLADNQENLVQYMESVKSIEKIPDIIYEQLNEKMKSYFIIGGMPEVVKAWVTAKDIETVNRVQKQILNGYEDDFGKHADSTTIRIKISIVWESIISQLARENKKFLYQVAKDGARAREYEDAVNWLNDSNIVNKIFNVKKPDFPIVHA